jgi:hypothetical protein
MSRIGNPFTDRGDFLRYQSVGNCGLEDRRSGLSEADLPSPLAPIIPLLGVSDKPRDGGGDCEVRWIVETAGSGGTNYAVHSLCTSASLPEKTQTKDIIVRPLGPDRAAMGRSFEDLKNYQRCP